MNLPPSTETSGLLALERPIRDTPFSKTNVTPFLTVKREEDGLRVA